MGESSSPEAEASPRTVGASLGVEWLPPGLTRWEPALVDTARRHGINPALLAIVTLVESLGDPAARSPSGALGLMQLLPSTARGIAAARELQGHTEERLLDPDYNLDFGAWYLSRQLASFGAGGAPERAIELAAVAYNGGPALGRAYVEQAAALPRETERYRDLVVGMWNEREQPRSPTYDAWRDRLREANPRP